MFVCSGYFHIAYTKFVKDVAAVSYAANVKLIVVSTLSLHPYSSLLSNIPSFSINPGDKQLVISGPYLLSHSLFFVNISASICFSLKNAFN